MRLVDLSATIAPSPPEMPAALRTDIEYHGHAQGARDIEALLGVPPHLLRDGEGWAVETFTNLAFTTPPTSTRPGTTTRA